ncbi:uncharacterized protein LOC110728871 [Chenopodium quinoa]|uniref:uncharacterized protein LOC110728871 n=1 Tax=Chenopodium quinoa TaxID=63459 RepID=UPI000B78E39D|nr:uncharacterized protein LOC110728871 [Chenopodium quinoa]
MELSYRNGGSIDEEKNEKSDEVDLAHPWNAHVPPKIKHFGWRVLQRAIPVRHNLKKRRMCDEDICLMCGDAAETIEHTLIFCEAAKACWNLSPLRLQFQADNLHSFSSWCTNMGGILKEKLWWNIFWCILWGIWLKRYAWCFEKKEVQVEEVIRRAVSIVGEYEKNEAIGLGGIVRDNVGDVLLSTCHKLMGCYDVDIAEAMAARHFLGVAFEAGLNKLTHESDNLKLIQHLNSRKSDNSYFGLIVNDILHLAGACQFIAYSHIGRKGNSAAHTLARISKNYVEMRVWLEEAPTDVNTAIAFDLAVA